MADLSDGTRWFETDGANNLASPNGWPEGMMPSGVNDSARNDKGALKRFWDKINPVQQITPSGGVWTFTTSNAAYPAAYIDGELYSFKAGGNSAGGDQFRVNALTSKPIWKRVPGGTGFTPIAVQDIVSDLAPQLIHNAAINGGSGAFILLNPFVPVTGDGAGGVNVGALTATGTIQAAQLTSTGNINATGAIAAQGYVSAVGNLYGGDLHLAGATAFFSGATGAVNTTGGPLIYADPSNHVYKLGSGTGSFLFQNYAGTNVANISPAGAFTGTSVSVSGAINATGNITAPAFVGQVSVPSNGPVTTGGTVTGGTVTSTGNISANGNVTAAGSVTGGIIHSTGTCQIDGQCNFLQTVNIGPGGGYARIDGVGTYNNSGAWLTFSDRRVKEDIQPYSRGLEAIIALDPVTYVYRPGTPFADDRRTVRLGLVAQDVLPVLPELVGTTTLAGEEVATLLPGNLVYALVNAAKELAARNAELAARVAALEADAVRE